MISLGAVIVDFDGTLVESVGIKDSAFRMLFAKDYPDRVDAIMAYHLAHNATVRFDKFRHVTQSILGEPYTEARATDLAARFSALVEEAIVACPPVDGLDLFLSTLEAKVPLYLASVSPDDELKRILAARGLDSRMTGIYGASWRKVDAIRDVLVRESIGFERAIFVGDTEEDRSSAESAGVAFIGRNSGKPFANGVTSYSDLYGVLQDIVARAGW